MHVSRRFLYILHLVITELWAKDRILSPTVLEHTVGSVSANVP